MTVNSWTKTLSADIILTVHFFSLSSVETINDGSFHVVELVAKDQSLSLSIDGGSPKSINTASSPSPGPSPAPLYLGGMSNTFASLKKWLLRVMSI